MDISTEMHMEEDVDYIIHAASNADPAMMAKYPVDTLLANVVGINNLLDLAKRKMHREYCMFRRVRCMDSRMIH